MPQSKAASAGKSQSQRQKFVEAARDLECDDSEAIFDAALKKIGAVKPGKKANGSPSDGE